MKKKVRIYRAPDGQGAFLNKTAKFLKKAQEGGMPDPDMMSYPGAQQQGEMSEDQIAQSIVIDISNGRPKEETVVKLVQVLGQDPMVASQYYDQIYSALESQKEEMEDEADEDSEEEPIKEEIALSEPQEEIEEDFYGDDSNTDMANEIAAEDDGQDFDDDDQVASDIIMQFGGVSPVFAPIKQEGGESYPIQFPGVEAYLPFNMAEMLSGEVDPLTGQAWSPQAEEQAAVAPDDEVQTDFRKGGQYKKDKKVYVNSMLKLAKKQMGGEDMSKKGDTDPRGEDVRKERLNAFIGTVKNEAQLAKTKEQAEQQFDQMMQQQQMQQQYPMEQPMAQFGMQMGRGFFGRPRMPRGVGYGYGAPISKIDVRRTGIFGRPKEYSIEFGASPMPGMPGSGAGFYGYGQTIKKGKSKGRIITETVSSTINNKSTEDVAKATDSNAANTSAQNWDKDNNGTPDSIQANPIQPEKKIGEDFIYNNEPAPGSGVLSNNSSTPGTTANNVQVNTAESNKRKGVEVNNEATDAILNNSNAKRNQLKGASLRPDIESYVKKATGKKDKWGRPEGSKWYGFDPVKKKYVQGSKSKNLINFNPITVTPFSAKNVVPFGYQEGGLVDSPMPDQFGNLQQFIYGGNDPYFTQEDLDDVYSKDTSDPYFQDGGGYDDYRKRVGDKLQMSLRDDLSAKELFEMGQKAGIGFGDDNESETTTTRTVQNQGYNSYPNVGYNGFNMFGNLFPANIASYQGSWGKVKRGPYNTATGAMLPGYAFGPNTQVKSINVTKSGLFGRPKKYTINYGNQEMDPRKQNLITLPGQGTPGTSGYAGQETAVQQQGDRFSNTKGLKAGTRAKVAMKELFNRYKDEEEIPTGDVASTSNQPSPTQTPLSDEEEAVKFQHQQRQRGKRWDEEKQSWVDQEKIHLDLKKPSLLGPSESLARAKYEEAIKAQGSRADQNRPVGNVTYEQRNKRISPSKEKLNELYNRDVMQQQYGGDLSRFTGSMQRFPTGGSPVTYTDNPALVGMSNVDMISLNEGIPGLQPSSFWGDQASFNAPAPVNPEKQPEQIKIDPTQISSDQAKKEFQATPGEFSVDYKMKNMYEIDPEAAINVANAGVRGVTGMIDRMRNKKKEAKMYENLTADNLYASDPSRDRGDYDVNTGLYRPDEQGAVHTSRSAQYGGMIYEDGGNYDAEDDDVTYMTEDQIKQFLANGGEIEYL